MEKWAAVRAWAMDEDAHPNRSLVFQVVFIVLVAKLYRFAISTVAELELEDFESWAITPHFFSHTDTLLTLLLIGVPLFSSFRSIAWRRLEYGRHLQLAISVLVFSFTWAFTTYRYNFYFDQAHAFDRLLLLVVGGLAIWHPAFLPHFLLIVAAIAQQFLIPTGWYSWDDKDAPFDILVAFCAFLTLRAVFRAGHARSFVIVGVSIMASNYFFPGLKKIWIDWWEMENLAHLFTAAYDVGWMAFLDEQQMLKVRSLIEALNRPLILFTLIAEVGALFALLHRRVAIGYCLAWVALHAGIFLTSGILFWKWALADLSLAFLLLSIQIRPAPTRFGFWLPLLLSAVMIVGPTYTRPVFLLWKVKGFAWYDTRLSGVFRFFGEGESGRRYEIAARDIAPYDFMFAQNDLPFPERILTNTYSQTRSREYAELIETFRGPEDYRKFLASYTPQPERKKVREKREAIIELLATHFSRMNERQGRPFWWYLLEPPNHQLTYETMGVPFIWREPIREIEIEFLQILYLEGRRSVISRETVARIPVPRTDHAHTIEGGV